MAWNNPLEGIINDILDYTKIWATYSCENEQPVTNEKFQRERCAFLPFIYVFSTWAVGTLRLNQSHNFTHFNINDHSCLRILSRRSFLR